MKQSVYDYSFEMRQNRNRHFSLALKIVISVVVFITVFLNFVIFPVLVRSDTMEPDIAKNGAVFVAPLDRNPSRGDVVYISSQDNAKLSTGKQIVNTVCQFFTLQQFYPFGYTKRMSGKPTVRRVVGLPGDTVYIKDYVAYVKPSDGGLFLTEFELAKKSYNTHIYSVPVEWDGIGSVSNYQQIVLGEDEYFVLADNRIESADSRVWGPVDGDRIKGRAVLEYFPFQKFKFL